MDAATLIALTLFNNHAWYFKQERKAEITSNEQVIKTVNTNISSCICTSSTTPEVLAIIEALNKMQTIGLKNAIITSDSMSATNYIHDLFNAPTTTRIQTKINNNSSSIEKSAKDIKNITKNLNYVTLIHTKGH